MTREEELCRRLCGYLDLGITVTESGITFIPPGNFNACVRYYSFKEALFGEAEPFEGLGAWGLCQLCDWFIIAGCWKERQAKAFRFGSLDELELKLAVRGF